MFRPEDKHNTKNAWIVFSFKVKHIVLEQCFFCWNKQNSITALNQIYYPLEHLCGMTLSNLRGCQMSDLDLKGVGEHNGDTGCILSEKNLNQRLGGGFHAYQALFS